MAGTSLYSSCFVRFFDARPYVVGSIAWARRCSSSPVPPAVASIAQGTGGTAQFGGLASFFLEKCAFLSPGFAFEAEKPGEEPGDCPEPPSGVLRGFARFVPRFSSGFPEPGEQERPFSPCF